MLPASTDEARLRDALAKSSDEALIRIVALLDGMPNRPDRLENLIAESRPRIRALRPSRPLTFTRLLFLPLEGAIVPTSEWKPGTPTLPRNALPHVGLALREAMGHATQAMDTAIAGRDFGQRESVGSLGASLWTIGCLLSNRLRPPAGWPLPDEHFAGIVALSASVWRHAEAFWQALRHSPASPPDHLVRHAIRAAANDPMAVAVMLATLLHRSSRPGSVAAMAREVSPEIAEQVEVALDAWIERNLPAANLGEPDVAARVAERLGTIIEDLEASGFLSAPARRQHMTELRMRVEQSCRQAFLRVTEDYLRARPEGAAAAGTEEPTADTHSQLMRRLEAAGRRIGGGAIYDGLLRRLSGEAETLLYRKRLAAIASDNQT